MKKRNFIFSFLFSGFVIALAAGCSGGSSSGKASIKIALPNIQQAQSSSRKSVSALGGSTDSSGTKVIILVVSVKGPGIAEPITYRWNRNDSSTDAAPSVVALEVPNGASREFQVLYVYENDDEAVLTYGSVTRNITGDDALPISVTRFSTSTNTEGRIAGRYLNSAGVGPTDKIEIYLSPPGSTLNVLVEKSEMIGGYFNLFGMTDVGFTYKFSDGTLMFPAQSKLLPVATNPLYPTNGSTSMVFVPKAYKSSSNSGDDRKASVLLFGYFGPGVTSLQSVCYDNASGNIANAFLDSNFTTQIPWTSVATSLASLIANQSAGVIAGGTGTSCVNAPYAGYLKIQRDNLANGDDSVPFRGAYAKLATNQFLSFANEGANLRVSWSYLAALLAGPTPITGSQVFYASPAPSSSDSYSDDNNGYKCDKLVSAGFTAMDPVTGDTNSVLLPSLSVNSNLKVIVCPYRQEASGRKYFAGAVEGYPQLFTGVAPYHLMLTATVPTNGAVVTPLDSIPANATSPVTLQVVDAQNKAVAVGGATMSLALTYTELKFDNNTSNGSVTLDAQGRGTFNIHVGNNEQVSSLTAYSPGGISGVVGTVTLTLPVGPMTGEPMSIRVYTYMVPSSNAIGACVPVQYALLESTSQTVLRPSSVNITFLPTSTGGAFYSSPDCSGSVATTVTIPAGKVMSYLYFKPSATSSIPLGMSGTPTNHDGNVLTLGSTGYIYVNP